MSKEILIEVSARHIHLSREDLEILFGNSYELKVLRWLSYPGQFAAEETLEVINGDRKIESVRIIGPVRTRTQVELSKSDARCLGIEPPVRISGDLDNSPGIILKSKLGQIQLREGVIVPHRHVHCNFKMAEELGLKNEMLVSVKTNSEKPVTFHNVKVTIRENSCFSLHLDVDEGNCAGIHREGKGVLILE
jgi:putative phosphotransacetylase